MDPNTEQLNNTLGNVFSRSNRQDSPTDSVTKWRMDTAHDIQEMEQRFLGRVWDSKKRLYVPSDLQLKICSEKGVGAARLYLSHALSKSSIQANLTEDQFNSFMESIIDGITKDIGLNYVDYGIKEKHRELFIETIVRMIFLILSRSVGDKEREYSVRQGKETFVQKYMVDPLKKAVGGINL